MIREVVTIDEELCDGCGDCVPSCEEGAIQIIEGKARLVSDVLCDGLGACLGHCPQGAINVERREAVAFDEAAAERHVAELKAVAGKSHSHAGTAATLPDVEDAVEKVPCGCPSAQFARMERPSHSSDGGACCGGGANGADGGGAESELTHWPIQLRLLPPTAPVLKGARLLFAADCVPFAYRGFHSELLRDHAVVIACPKLDDPSGYVEKLTEIIRHNNLAEISVARMEVPCCSGILQMVLQARQLAGSGVVVNDIVISVRGSVLTRREILADRTTGSGDCESVGCPSTRS